MLVRGRAIIVLSLQGGQHLVGDGVMRIGLDEFLEQRNRALIVGLKENLHFTFERGDICGGKVNGFVEGSNRVSRVALERQGNSLHRPKAIIGGLFLEVGSGDGKRLIVLPGTDQRLNFGQGGSLSQSGRSALCEASEGR